MTDRQIFVYVNGEDAAELAGAAQALFPGSQPIGIVAGSRTDAACQRAAASFAEVWKVDHASLAYPNAELLRPLLVKTVPMGSVVLLLHGTFAMDLAPGLSVKLGSAYVPDVVSVERVEGSTLKALRQEFAGQVSTHVECDLGGGAVITLRSGVFQPAPARTAAGRIVDRSADAAGLTARRRFVQLNEAKAGDVDITREDVLVSVGRGIGEKDNIAIAEELAEALGAVVSCSRPVVDAKWLPKSRQVGSSGQTVKPKVYLACGVSGSFQHLAGLKGNPFIVAINKNPKAPIFQVADVGIVTDMLEFMPELAEKVREAKKVTA